ncbi:MAG: hypothetical protein HEEMFOPI_00372 [Holosporales bacterium]
MSFFDQNFYRIRQKTWGIIDSDFLLLIEKTFELLKAKESTPHKILSVLDSDYKNHYLEHFKNLFKNPLDETLKVGTLKNLEYYGNDYKNHYIKHQRFFKKILKDFISKKLWYNPFLAFKMINCIDDMIDFELNHVDFDQKNILPLADDQNYQVINDFSSVLNQNLEAITNRLTHSSLELKDYTLDINKLILGISSKTREASDACSSLSNKASNTSLSIEQLSFAIREIAKQVYRMSSISQKSKDQAKSAEGIVNDLTKAVSRIDEVVLLISEIANQTNLLALNATIESARSGNAGKGFAVVASEVKKLATQTSQATEEIKQKIKEIQNHTSHVVGAIHDINTTIYDINQTTSVVSVSIEEQSTVTQDIYRTMSDLVAAFHRVVQNLSQVKDISNHAEEDIARISTMTQNITSNSSNINDVVKKFTNFNLN